MKRPLLSFILLSTTLLACGLMEALTDEALPTLIPTLTVRVTTQASLPASTNSARVTNTNLPNTTSTVTPTTAAAANATLTPTLPDNSTATAPTVAQATTSAPNQTATKTSSAATATKAANTSTATKGVTASSTIASAATTVSPSATRTNTVPAPSSTNTSVPTNTRTASPVPPTATKTNTPLPPTATFTPVPPTLTFTPAPSSCSILNSGFENTVISLINAERAARGLGQLTAQSALMSAARTHSIDMACQNFLSHTGSDGSSPFDRMARFGYSFSAAAENVYAGSGPYNSPQAAFDGWMNSTGHRDNMLNPVYIQIGSGYAFNANSQYGGYFTTTFGKP